jgi:hypothetical protein
MQSAASQSGSSQTITIDGSIVITGKIVIVPPNSPAPPATQFGVYTCDRIPPTPPTQADFLATGEFVVTSDHGLQLQLVMSTVQPPSSHSYYLQGDWSLFGQAHYHFRYEYQDPSGHQQSKDKDALVSSYTAPFIGKDGTYTAGKLAVGSDQLPGYALNKDVRFCVWVECFGVNPDFKRQVPGNKYLMLSGSVTRDAQGNSKWCIVGSPDCFFPAQACTSLESCRNAKINCPASGCSGSR